MKQIKKMIFNYIEQNQITNEEAKKLLFALAKETAKTKAINRLVLLNLSNTKDFSNILEDVLQQAMLNYYEYLDIDLAYKNTQKYIYNQHTKRQENHTDIDTVEHLLSIDIDTDTVTERFIQYSIKLDTKEKQEYYKSLVIRTQNNLKSKQKRVFTSSRQKEQTINKLQKLQII